MDRRSFIRKACRAGAGSAFILAAPGAGSGRAEDLPAVVSAAETAAKAAREACERDRKFSREWILNVVGNLEGKLDEASRTPVLEECGRACARKGAVKAAAAHKGDVDGLLNVLRGWIGEGNARRDGDTVTLVYERCYCPNLSSFEGAVPRSYCECSRGWVKEMFETAAGRPCDVTLVSSIRRGDKECRFVVRV